MTDTQFREIKTGLFLVNCFLGTITGVLVGVFVL